MISIGNDYGGPELKGSQIQIALSITSNVASEVRKLSYNDGSEPWINAIYMIPGSVYTPEFEGYEFGYFSKKKKGLVVMIAVPQSVADGNGIPDFICESLREAAKLAAEKFSSKGIGFSTLDAEKIIGIIEEELYVHFS